MEIYYQMESKENREDKNVQKYVGKSDLRGSLIPQSRGDSLPTQETRPDLDEVGAPCSSQLCGQLQLVSSQKSGSIVRELASLFIPFKYHPQSIPESDQVSLLHEHQL